MRHCAKQGLLALASELGLPGRLRSAEVGNVPAPVSTPAPPALVNARFPCP